MGLQSMGSQRVSPKGPLKRLSIHTILVESQFSQRVTPDVHSLQISFSKPSQRASRRTPWPSPAARDPESLYFLPSPSSHPVSFALLAKMHLHPSTVSAFAEPCDINAGP